MAPVQAHRAQTIYRIDPTHRNVVQCHQAGLKFEPSQNVFLVALRSFNFSLQQVKTKRLRLRSHAPQ